MGKTWSTDELVRQDKAHLLHPVSNLHQLQLEGPLVFTRGEGVFLWDSDGNRFIDSFAGLWNVNVGHGRKELAEVMRRQAEELAFSPTYFGLAHPPVIELAAKLSQMFPDSLNHFHFTSGGSDRLVARIAATGPKIAAVLHVGINIFSVAVMAIYLALHPGVYREWLIALFPPVHRDLVRDVLGDLASQLRSWIVGQLFAMFTLALLTAIGLYLLKVPYWLTFGIFTGAVAIVPFFGTLVSTLVPALFVLGGEGIWGFGPGGHALLVVLLGTVIHVVESNVVIPLIVANRVHLPPVLTIMSVLVVGKLMGASGLLVAVPALVTTMVVVRRILVNRIYEGQGFRRTTRDRVLVLRVPVPEGGVLVPDASGVDMVVEPPGVGEVRVERKIA